MLNKKIVLIFVFAFLIRLIALNQSLWLDEAVTANVVKNLELSQIISKFSLNDFHPPLYYFFMKLWTNFFGYSEVALRMPSVLFSLLTGYVVYLIGGVWSAVFFLFNPLIIYYSQEARMYMMATFFLTGGLYCLLKKSKKIFLFSLFLILSFYTFYGSIFLIVAMLLYLLFKKQYKYFFVSFFLFLFSFILISPLLYQQFLHSKISLAQVTNWSRVLGKSNIKNLLLIPIKFSIGRISFYPKWLYWGIAGIWIGFILFTIKTVLNKTVFYLFIFPLVLGFLVSFFTPMLQYFRFIYLIPLMSLLLSINLQNLASYNLRGWILAVGFLIFSLVYLLNPAFHREDWKSLTKSLPKNRPIYMIKASSDPIKYYNDKLIIKELRMMDYELRKKEIVIISYTANIYGLDYKNDLRKMGYKLKKEVSFREVTYEQWTK
mgnify:CR=1 FL=1